MRKKSLVLIFFILVGLFLEGCSIRELVFLEDAPVLDAPTVTDPSSDTPEPEPEWSVEATQTVQPTFTPTVEMSITATLQEKAENPEFLLDCPQNFCQAEWPGFLERPFAVDFRRTIDPTYPYANTKDGTLEAHHGVEFPNGYGTPVQAAADGEVVFAGDDELTVLGPYTHFYGNVVMLRHPGVFFGEDLFTVYAHLSVMVVDEGDLVSVGERIGEVGASGAADGPHLHFEVRLGANDYDQTYNPLLWFAPINTDQPDQKGAALAGIIRDRYDAPVDKYDFVLEALDSEGTIVKRYYPRTYVLAKLNAYPDLGENFVIPDLPPGDYRLVYIAGAVHDVYFTLEPGGLGWISIKFD